MKKKAISLSVALFWTFALFCGIIIYIFPVKYNNWGGEHMWLSGSSVKFVNMWLQEGAYTHRFNVYESFDTIEYNTLSERGLYVSYPTGSTLFLYLAAKLFGCTHVDISFLKHFDVVLFGIESLLMTTFVYMWITDTGYENEKGKILMSVVTAISWVLLPNSIYYLCNVYYADQAVILWITAFLLVEFLCNRNSQKHYILNSLKVFIIYTGMLVDYYFWIMVFVAFIMQLLKNICSRRAIREIIQKSLLYIIPVILALLTFYWQLSYTDGWFDMLLEKFLLRTGVEEKIRFRQLLDNLSISFTNGNVPRMYPLIGLEVMMLLLGGIVLLKNGKLSNLVVNNNVSIIIIGMLSPVLHVILLKNHFIAHGFAPLKFDWVYVMSFLCMAYILTLLCKKNVNVKIAKCSAFFLMYILCIALWNVVAGNLFSLETYVDERTYDATNDLENVIYKITDDNDVLFSFTKSVPPNPPVALAISEKEVHQINKLSEIDDLFPNLSPKADVLFVIDKLIDTRTDEIEKKEMQVLAQGELIYEDNLYQIVKLRTGVAEE